MTITIEPKSKAEMLIRRSIGEVFEAFVDPAVTTKFWFTKSSGRLQLGKQVRWEWEMYGVASEVIVKEFQPPQRIVVEWSGFGTPTTVEWLFRSIGPDTFVSITHRGFSGEGDQIFQQSLQSTEGFTIVLAGLKAWLEHGVELNLVGDRFPRGLESEKE